MKYCLICQQMIERPSPSLTRAYKENCKTGPDTSTDGIFPRSLPMRRLYSGFFLLLVSASNVGTLTAKAQSPSGIETSYSAQTERSPDRPRFVAEYSPSYFFDTNVLPDNFRNPYLWLGQSSRTSSKAPKPSIEKVKRATIDPSIVGYIDNAIVHSE